MTLELSPLQKHCLTGMGITPWQQRQEVVNTVAYESVKTDVQVELSDPNIAEPASDYKHQIDDIIPPAFLTEIELAINYVMEHSGIQLDWKVDKNQSSLSLLDNTIIIPNAAEFLTENDVKRQAWQLITKHTL